MIRVSAWGCCTPLVHDVSCCFAHLSEAEMYACSLCDKTFSIQRSLKRHRESVHRQSAGFSCQVCNKHLYRQDVLRKHMKSHQPAVPAPDVRGPSAAFPLDSAAKLQKEPPLAKHREMLVCDVRCKTFSTQKTLKRHPDSTHHQSAGFACRLCNQRFYRKDNLRKHHTRKHSDEQYETPAAHTCPICQKSFHYRGYLIQYQKTHQPTSPTVSPPTQSTQLGLRIDARACPADLLASVPEECRQCYRDNWSQIRSGQRGGRVLQVRTQRLETGNDNGDILRALFRTQTHAFKINMSFGFI